MAVPSSLELKRVGQVLKFEVVPTRKAMPGEHYDINIRNLLSRSSLHFTMTHDELIQLHQWVTQTLAYRAGAFNKRYTNEPPF